MAKKSTLKPEHLNPDLFGLRSIETIHESIVDIVEKRNVSYIEAIVIYSEENDVDIEDIGEMIKGSMNLREIVKREAIESRMLTKDAEAEDLKVDIFSFFSVQEDTVSA